MKRKKSQNIKELFNNNKPANSDNISLDQKKVETTLQVPVVSEIKSSIDNNKSSEDMHTNNLTSNGEFEFKIDRNTNDSSTHNISSDQLEKAEVDKIASAIREQDISSNS